MISIGSRVLADGSVCAQVEKPVQNRTLCPGSSLDFDFGHWNRTDPTEDIRLFLCLNPGQGIV